MAVSPSTSPRVYSALDKGLGDPLIWIVDVPHERRDNLKMQNIFPKMSLTQGEIRWAGPEELGQHNAEVYGERARLQIRACYRLNVAPKKSRA